LIDILCVVFLNHTTLDPDNTFPHFTLIDFRAVAGLHPDGFRRATEMPEDWTDLNDPAYSYGLMKRGDIVGPWILVDMQNALSAMKWSSESMYSGDVSQGDLTKAVYTYWEEGETQQEWKDRTYADYLTATPVVDAGGLGGMYCTSGSGDGMSVNGRQVKYSFTNKTAVPRGVSFYYTQTGEIHDAGTFFSDQLGFTFEQGGTYHLEDVEETSETTVPMSYYFGVDFDQYLLIPDWGEWRGMIPRRSGRGGAFKIIWNFTNSNE